MNSSTDIDQQLARRIKKGDVQAFDQLYERYSQRVYGFAFSMLKNREDAKEIVQETFLKIWNKHDKIFKNNIIYETKTNCTPSVPNSFFNSYFFLSA